MREALQAIPVGGKRIETAYKTKELLGRIFKFAMNQYEELGVTNIPDNIETKEILGKRPDNNLAAILERSKIGELLRAIESYSGQPATSAAQRCVCCRTSSCVLQSFVAAGGKKSNGRKRSGGCQAHA